MKKPWEYASDAEELRDLRALVEGTEGGGMNITIKTIRFNKDGQAKGVDESEVAEGDYEVSPSAVLTYTTRVGPNPVTRTYVVAPHAWISVTTSVREPEPEA
jgi:hypothetical protein